MSRLWHPLATLFLCDPHGYATEGLARMLLRAGRLRLRYAGDRMWPVVRHGQTIDVRPALANEARAGAVALVSVDGVPELLRVQRAERGKLTLGADADPDRTVVVDERALLGVTSLGRRRVGKASRHTRRLALDLAEAWNGRIDRDAEPARTVQSKYDAQASFYVDVEGVLVEPSLVAALDERCEPRSEILVVGSGTGRECFGLALAGYRVLGVDFAPAMVAQARLEARRRELAVEFAQADVREFDPGSRRFAAIVFTYEVYSFVPGREERVALLRRMVRWLSSPALVLLSARRVRSLAERVLLSVQFASSLGRGDATEWGSSHSRWITADGELRRSYLRLFSEAGLRREARAAGLEIERGAGGHSLLVPAATMIG